MRPPSSRGERDSFRGEEEEEEERWPRLMLASRRGSKNVVLLSFLSYFLFEGGTAATETHSADGVTTQTGNNDRSVTLE